MTNARFLITYATLCGLVLPGCGRIDSSFDRVLNTLSKNTHPVVLNSPDGSARIIVVPRYQGRIVASTSGAINEVPSGWFNLNSLNDSLTANGSGLHGEERVWIGPLGSQLSFFYGRKQPLDEGNWQVPAAFNAEPFEVVSSAADRLMLQKNMCLTNYLQHTLNMRLRREIVILAKDIIPQLLGMNPGPEVQSVAYETNQTLYNTDSVAWDLSYGVATIWSISTFKATNGSVVIIPVEPHAPDTVLTYLSSIDSSRLSIHHGAVWYKTDGKYRNKIGVPPAMSRSLLGNYQPETNTLRIIQFSQGADTLYFNSLVAEQLQPFKGEAIAVYNHGPMDLSVSAENAFFEMETAAPVKALKPGESISHTHRVFQFVGNKSALNAIACKVLGVDLPD